MSGAFTTMPLFLVLAVCAFASSFSLRIFEPLTLPLSTLFGLPVHTVALLSTTYAFTYAVSQPFIGPLSDRVGRMRCIQVCVVGLTVSLLASALAPSFALLMVTRAVAGVFGGGLVPVVLAALGDAYRVERRQVAIGRMLVATVGGQMMGALVSGQANAAFGWHGSVWIACGIAALASVLAFFAPQSHSEPRSSDGMLRSLAAVFENRRTVWLLGCVFFEGALFFGMFPYLGELFATFDAAADTSTIARHAGIAIGVFGVGGVLYAILVPTLVRELGMRRMCIVSALIAAVAFIVLAAVTVWWVALPPLLGLGLAFYMIHNSLQTEATELAPVARGSTMALFACSLFLGQAAGPPLFSVALDALGWTGVFCIHALFVGLLAAAVLRRVLRRAAVAQSAGQV